MPRVRVDADVILHFVRVPIGHCAIRRPVRYGGIFGRHHHATRSRGSGVWE